MPGTLLRFTLHGKSLLAIARVPTTSPQNGTKLSFFRNLVCTTGHRIPASSGTNPGTRKRGVGSAVRAGGTVCTRISYVFAPQNGRHGSDSQENGKKWSVRIGHVQIGNLKKRDRSTPSRVPPHVRLDSM